MAKESIHSWQFDDEENNTQYVWLTERQFYQNLFSGDGNMIADVVLLSGDFEVRSLSKYSRVILDKDFILYKIYF